MWGLGFDAASAFRGFGRDQPILAGRGGLQGLLKIKDTQRPQGGPMLLGLALLWEPTAVLVLNFE